MKCNQSRPGFELESPCPFPATITITPRAPPWLDNDDHTHTHTYFKGNADVAWGIFELPGASWLRLCARTHLKKGLEPHSSRWWDSRQILLQHSDSDFSFLISFFFLLLFCLFFCLSFSLYLFPLMATATKSPNSEELFGKIKMNY